ncbi:MAG TPA: DUF3618 domain-containing protein [Jatrophihabitantaceae bacterium]|nr:DUF3618 domain-containing protein [Jatrophihabitantaceae bacterium]
MVAAERSPDEIQHDIEQARASLAVAVDQLAQRTSPKRVADNAKNSLVAKAKSPQGMAVIGGTSALVVFLVVRRIRKR